MQVDGSILGAEISIDSYPTTPPFNIAFINVDGDIAPHPSDASDRTWISTDQILFRVRTLGDMIDFAPGERPGAGAGYSSVVHEVFCGGDFRSSVPLNCSPLRQMNIGGDFDAELTLVDSLPNESFGGSFDAQGQIRIDGSLKAGSSITFPSLGLMGEVIVNHGDDGGQWLGDVIVGASTLGPAYSTAASALGGGSVGGVPFEAHQADSVPAVGANLALIGTSPDFAIRHYGPVQISGTGETVKIKRRALCVSGAEWLDITPQWGLSYSVESTDRAVLELDSSLIAGTTVEDSPFRSGYEYVFVVENDAAVAGALRCDLASPGLDGEPGVAAYIETAWFTAGSGCPVDVDASGTIDLPDLNAVLANSGTTGTNVLGDTDGDGDCDLQDLNAVLGSFGMANSAVCCPAPMMMFGGGGTSVGDTIAQSLGFSDVDDLCDTVAILPEEGRAIVFDALREEAAGW